MGGWISMFGRQSDFDARLIRFIKIFSVSSVPHLRTKRFTESPTFKTLFWAWNENSLPDLFLSEIGSFVLISFGVVTGLGSLCSLPTSQEEAMRKVLELWILHGDNAIGQINGSFSFLFYDKKMNKVTLFTDRFASRSVWISKEQDGLIVGNLPSAIAVMMQDPPEFDPAGLWSFFHAGRQLGCHGLYSNFQAMMAGQKAILSNDKKVVISHWFRRKYCPKEGESASNWGNRLAHALKNSALRHKKIAKSPHLFLSGGLDSRIVAAAFDQPLQAISLCTQHNMETRIAALVSRIIGLDHQILVRSPYWYYNTLDASALVSSGLYLNQHVHFIVPVNGTILHDEGAEFLLGDLLENFNKHYFSIPRGASLAFSPETVGDVLFNYCPYSIKNFSRLGRHFNKDIRNKLATRYQATLSEYANSFWDVSVDQADRLDTLLRWANVGVTPTFNMISCLWPLAKERNLYLDNELDELSLKIPASMRGRGILHKWILYHLNRKLVFVPDANTFLLPFFPKKAKILTRKLRPWLGKLRRSQREKNSFRPQLGTSGSWLLMHEMYRKDRLYREQIETMLFDSSIFPPDIFNLDGIKETWKEFLAGNVSLEFEIEALRSYGSLQRIVPCKGISL
jgi:hypothetical protein